MGKFIVVDVESDGPIPYKYSMVSFAAVVVDDKLDKTFYGKVKPISDLYIPEALAISKISREEHLTHDEPLNVMLDFKKWIDSLGGGRPIFISDNLAYDWQWINWYFHNYIGENPFGHSGHRIGCKFNGFYNDMYYKWKKHRKTKHTHNPVDDAKGNAEALLYLKSQGFKLQI